MSLLPWHQPTATALHRLVAADRLPHALLLTGQAGWGEIRFANWLAQHLLGLDEAGDARMTAHPDLRWIAPEGAIIKIDAIRELAEFAQGTPQAGARKVAVLADAHAMNRNAANALLKTLEEPPPGTHLLLVSSRPGQLLPTIRSRCQRFLLGSDVQAARTWLSEQVATNDLEQRWFEYGGAPVAIAEACAAGEATLEPLLRGVLDAGVAEAGATARLLADQGLAGVSARWLRYVTAALGADEHLAWLGAASPRAIAAFADELLWVRGQLLASNSVNERLMAERLLASWRGLAKS